LLLSAPSDLPHRSDYPSYATQYVELTVAVIEPRTIRFQGDLTGPFFTLCLIFLKKDLAK